MTIETFSYLKTNVRSNWKRKLLASAVLLVLVLPVKGDETNPLVIAGASPTEGLVLSTTAAAFTRTVQIINTTNAKISVTVELSDLNGPDSQPVKTTWQLNGTAGTTKVDIEGQEAARLEISATLPAAGLYQATISLIYNTKRVPVELKITRTSSAPPVSVLGLDPVTFDGWDTERVIRFSLKDTGGIPIVMHSPGLLSLTRKIGEKSFQAGYSSAKFYKVKSDGTLEPIVDSVQTGAHQSSALALKLTGVDSPGEYIGTFAVSSNDGALPAQQFSFFLKRPWYLCALLIAIGVTISHWLRNYTKHARPRLILTRRFTLLKEDFHRLSDQLTNAEDKDLLEVLRRRLDRAADEIDLSDVATVEPILNDLNAKLSLIPLWSTLRQRIEAVEPPSDADAARNELREAREFLEANNNNTEAEITAMRQKLRAALTSIDEVIRKRLVAEVEGAVKLAKAARADLSPVRQAEYDARVIATLDAAAAEIQKSPPNADEARKLINISRLASANILANDLQEKITLVNKPASMAPAEWTTLKSNFEASVKKVHEATEGTAAIKACEDAYAAYLRLLIEVARKIMDNEIQPAVDKQGSQQQKDELAQARQNLELADSRLRNGETTQAGESYEAAKTVLDKAAKWFPTGPQVLGPAAGVRAALASNPVMRLIPSLAVTEFTGPDERRHYNWLKLDKLKSQVKTRDLIVTVIVGAAAVALGLYNIWVDNPAWGTLKDGFVAVLWGLGLHQLAGNMLFARLDLTELAKNLSGKEAG